MASTFLEKDDFHKLKKWEGNMEKGVFVVGAEGHTYTLLHIDFRENNSEFIVWDPYRMGKGLGLLCRKVAEMQRKHRFRSVYKFRWVEDGVYSMNFRLFKELFDVVCIGYASHEQTKVINVTGNGNLNLVVQRAVHRQPHQQVVIQLLLADIVDQHGRVIPGHMSIRSEQKRAGPEMEIRTQQKRDGRFEKLAIRRDSDKGNWWLKGFEIKDLAELAQ